MYTIQVLWDETMADTAATWVKAKAGRRVVIIAGNGHCHDSAIVARLRRRGIKEALSVRPILDGGTGRVADAIVEARNDYLFVMAGTR